MTSWNAFQHDCFGGFKSKGFNGRNGGCPTRVLLTLVGVDASACCQSRSVFGADSSDRMNPLTVDGSYVFNGTPGEIISYRPETLTGYSFGTYERFNGVLGCVGTPDESLAFDQFCPGGFVCFPANVDIDADCKIRVVDIRIGDGSGRNTRIFSWSGTAALGDIIANQGVCGGPGTQHTNGGTCIITRA